MLDGFFVQPLAPHHNRANFHCGDETPDHYLQRYARKHDANNTTRLHVYANNDGLIAGYYTLSALSVELTGLPQALQRGRPRLPVPATLLGRLARDRQYRACGLGAFLLSHAMRVAHEASRAVASVLLVIDSKPHKVDWYRALAEFEAVPSNPNRLLLPMEAITNLIESGKTASS